MLAFCSCVNKGEKDALSVFSLTYEVVNAKHSLYLNAEEEKVVL